MANFRDSHRTTVRYQFGGSGRVVCAQVRLETALVAQQQQQQQMLALWCLLGAQVCFSAQPNLLWRRDCAAATAPSSPGSRLFRECNLARRLGAEAMLLLDSEQAVATTTITTSAIREIVWQPKRQLLASLAGWMALDLSANAHVVGYQSVVQLLQVSVLQFQTECVSAAGVCHRCWPSSLSPVCGGGSGQRTRGWSPNV